MMILIPLFEDRVRTVQRGDYFPFSDSVMLGCDVFPCFVMLWSALIPMPKGPFPAAGREERCHMALNSYGIVE